MPLSATKEVIGGVIVTRYNGNNPKGTREARIEGHARVRGSWIKKGQKAAAKRRNSEAAYARRYLGG